MNTEQKTLLTGIKPTGTPHIGNYLGAIQPAIDLVNSYERSFLFIADYHALNSVQDGARLHELSLSIAATWLACGLDPSKTTLYRQSAVPEVFELETILNAITPKGWMNKAHAYKAAVDSNSAEGRDRDEGVNMGLYTYPILMAADILLYSADSIPVGKDQVQHVEIARDIAQRFNHTFNSDILVLPEAFIREELESVPGLDGRKMSKSYDNVIPLFGTNDEWKKAINRIPTDSTTVEEPKNTDGVILFDVYKSLADAEQTAALKAQLEAGGIGWGHVKRQLLEVLEAQFGGMRDRYYELMANPSEVERILAEGAAKAKEVAAAKLIEVRSAIGAQ
jgi:tryptophanyl-tRNA synthetase